VPLWAQLALVHSRLFQKNTLGPLAGIGNQFPLGSKHDTVATHTKADPPGFKCDLANPLDPFADRLYSSHELLSEKRAIKSY
jgi:Gly-Xaa carboxypeptidase